MVFVFHCLAYFTQHDSLQFQPCCHKRQEFLLSSAVQYSIVFFNPSTDRHAGSFQPLAIVNSAAMNVGCMSSSGLVSGILRVYSQQWNHCVKRQSSIDADIQHLYLYYLQFSNISKFYKINRQVILYSEKINVLLMFIT